MIIFTPSIKKVFRPHVNEVLALSNSSGWNNVYEKLRFRDGLVWTVGLDVEIKLRFQISPAKCGRHLISPSQLPQHILSTV